ncbi:hypothetical protein [Novosphingobium sp.]|uniref:hypothetical protein n=1 Tax=Novosphingobium sp. TaxID=1874826 RepID=UPI0035AFEF1F
MTKDQGERSVIAGNLLDHPDLGRQCASEPFEQLIADNGVIFAMNRPANVRDYAVMAWLFRLGFSGQSITPGSRRISRLAIASQRNGMPSASDIRTTRRLAGSVIG